MLRVYDNLVEQHDLGVVTLAGLLCLLACYTAFSLAVRPAGMTRSRTPWLIAAAIVSGCGAWAAQLVALLAFQPHLEAAYDPGLSMLAGLIATAGCAIAFMIARRPGRMALSGAGVGIAIAGMVYVGLSAVSFPALKQWDPQQIVISLLVATSLAAASGWCAERVPGWRGGLAAAAMLGTSVLGTHLFAVSALTLVPQPDLIVPARTIGPLWFTIAITAMVFLIAGLGLIGALLDQQLVAFETTRQRLEEAVREADEANTAKSMFLANMSHELRTPLNAIIGFSEIMRGEMFGPVGAPRYREYVDDICRCGTHLLSLINDVLDMSKFDAGRLELHEERVAVHEVVKACVSAVRPSAEKAQVNLATELAGPEIFMLVDARRLNQILLNLLSNAVKFTPEDGRVTVSASADQGAIRIAVADTGIGMSLDQIPRALERFGQVDSRLARKHEGTGLGLPLTRCLAELHGGTLHIDSQLNIGTTVTVTFPASRLAGKREAA